MGNDSPPSNIQVEFSEIDSRRGWAQLYQKIRNDSSKNNHTILAAFKTRNRSLNRYRDVSPYDHSRVLLSKGRHDYINASLVKVEKARRQYILAQGPLRHTTGHFWLMVWEQNCKAIVMVTKIIEKNQEKCHLYWPMGQAQGGDDVMILNDVGLKVKFISEKQTSDFTTRILRLTEMESGKWRHIVHFHYTTWPDFGVPESPTAFLKFLAVVRESGALSPDIGPPVIHCSAGIGRSGMFCLVDSTLVLMKENGVDSVNTLDLLMEMRDYRMGLIQTPDQLRFSYLAIIEGITKTDWDQVDINDVLSFEDVNDNNSEDSPTRSPKKFKGSLGSNDDDDKSSLEDDLEDEDDDDDDDEDDDDEDDEDEQEDVPPPTPPPRTESLMSNKPLPSEPPSTPDHNLDNQQTIWGETLRERKRAESKQKTSDQLAEMKRKLEACEKSNQSKRSLMIPIAFGLISIILGGSLFYLYNK